MNEENKTHIGYDTPIKSFVVMDNDNLHLVNHRTLIFDNVIKSNTIVYLIDPDNGGSHVICDILFDEGESTEDNNNDMSFVSTDDDISIIFTPSTTEPSTTTIKFSKIPEGDVDIIGGKIKFFIINDITFFIQFYIHKTKLGAFAVDVFLYSALIKNSAESTEEDNNTDNE